MVGGPNTPRPDLHRPGHRLDSDRDRLEQTVSDGQVGVDSQGRHRPSRSSSQRPRSSSRQSRSRPQPRPSGTRLSRVKRTKLSAGVRPEASVATPSTGPAPMSARSASTSGHGTRSRTPPTNKLTGSHGTNRRESLTVCSGTVTPTSEDLEPVVNSGRSGRGATGATRASTGFRSSCVNIGSRP